jgi:dihydrofolate synthase/folylpolyglutamate synthase
LVQALKVNFGSPFVIAVISILADKDARGLLEALDSSVVEVIVTQSSSARAIPAEKLAELAREVFGADRVKVQANPQWALAEAALALPEGQKSAILVTGSITLVGEVLALKQIEAEQDV